MKVKFCPFEALENMFYSPARVQLIKALSPDELSDLHGRESRRQFILPAFNIKFLYKSVRNIELLQFTDDDDVRIKSNILSFIHSIKPKEGIHIESDDYYKQRLNINPEVDYYHAWDYNIRHSMPDVQSFNQ